MKVKVNDIKPNPFLNVERYPINKEKVESLKTSIQKTECWNNLVGRKNANGEVEIAYGHHHLQALKELGIEEIDINIKEMDNAIMLQMMAAENLDVWRPSASVLNETVWAAKTYLEKEIANCEEVNHLDKNIRMIFPSNSQLINCKKNGIGQVTIMKFLGNNWNQWQIQFALAVLNDDEIDRESVERFEVQRHGDAFRKAVKGCKLSIRDQKVIAEKILSNIEEQNHLSVKKITNEVLSYVRAI